MNELYTVTSKDFWNMLGKGIEIVIATADGGDVTARTVSVAPLEGKLYFSTFDSSVKCAQIGKNPRVAFCAGPIQIKGAARIMGSPGLPENKAASDALMEAFADDYAAFCNAPGVVLVEVILQSASFGNAEDGDVFLLDFTAQTAQKQKFNM